MRKLIFIIIIFFSLVIIYNYNNSNNRKKEVNDKEEKRGIFISYIEIQKNIKGKDIKESKKNIDEMINNISDFKFNMIILQVRSFSDAIYESNYFPWSSTVSSSEGVSPGYDILNYFIEKSHQKNIELHAWINPYRIRNTTDTSTISKKNKAYNWLNTDNVKITDKGIFYNPSSKDVQKLILNGVEELANNYNIDGIHYDDYFYPINDIDNSNYNEYKKTHDITQDKYHLLMVNNLVKETHKITKRKNILFGISPEGNIESNYNKNYADVYTWARSNKYVDYLMPQIYYGFNNEVKPFYQVINEWNDLIKTKDVKLIPALSLYKSGIKDVFAKSGENEWIENSDILMKQILVSRNTKNYGGFSIFRYDYMFSNDYLTKQVLNEKKNIKKVINFKKI